jgi:hypothetical protein
MANAEKLTTLTCLASESDADDLVKQIRADLEGRASILEVMRDYRDELQGSKDNNALPLRKLARLFELGSTPDRLEGHFYGVVPGLRTGDLHGLAADCGNLLGLLWGAAVGRVAPWVGKSFTSMSAADRAAVTGDTVPSTAAVFRGINHFNVIENAPVNVAAVSVLTVLWSLQEAPEQEQATFGHERNGGHFAAHKAPSIWPGTPREVFRLNYRYVGLKNVFPLVYLIDEMVQIADGLYLGQVLFATDRLFERYDPRAPSGRYHYQNFGYFLLFDADWNAEARRLFPHLEMPAAAVSDRAAGLVRPAPRIETPAKFSTLTLADPPDGNVDAARLAEVKADLAQEGDLMRLLKAYSDELDRRPEQDSPVFEKLNALFNAGVAPERLEGFYRGARVTFRSNDLISAFNVNTLNILWQVARPLSPWTGKRFDPISAERLAELTEGHETMEVPTFFGSNTVVFRTVKEKLIRGLMELVKAPMQPATEEERRRYGFEATCFYFIGRTARSILAQNSGKRVFQFNYRWKALRTPPPDNFCVDEVVQIAEGLILGQLIYATAVLKPWDPLTDPAVYRYRLFGYFLLLDEDWHQRRLRVGLDLENT